MFIWEKINCQTRTLRSPCLCASARDTSCALFYLFEFFFIFFLKIWKLHNIWCTLELTTLSVWYTKKRKR